LRQLEFGTNIVPKLVFEFGNGAGAGPDMLRPRRTLRETALLGGWWLPKKMMGPIDF